MSEDKKLRNPIFQFLLDWGIPIITAVVFAMLIKKFVFFNVEVPTTSMVPTINANDRLISTRVYNLENLQRGDIIVFYFKPADKLYIKRLIGLPGDHIEIKEGGVVYVNGDKLEEDYVENPDPSVANVTYDVPENKYFFLGDNRKSSSDARKWDKEYGITYIDGSEIKGKAQIKFYPFSDFGSIE